MASPSCAAFSRRGAIHEGTRREGYKVTERTNSGESSEPPSGGRNWSVYLAWALVVLVEAVGIIAFVISKVRH
jgi:hypothetical protein